MRMLPPGFDSEALTRIDDRLAAIRREHQVALPLVVESGSRAWGFPSPDSDYDVRFVFVRPMPHYVTPWPPRDVIETPVEGDLDINGWDLGKALKLLLNGNAVILEWLMSPIVYAADETVHGLFMRLAATVADRGRVARHYLHLGEGQWARSIEGLEEVPRKRVFYALRPAMALRWLRLHPEATVAPMHFPTLMDEAEVPARLEAVVGELLARKAVTRELGSAPLDPTIGAFILAELEAAREAFPAGGREEARRHRPELEAFMRSVVGRFGPNG